MIVLSICIPVYRPDEKFLDKIISLTTHLPKHTEILIYIDGSFSKYVNIKGVLSDRVYVFGDENNCGVAGARNRLIRKANGEYILWMDSDDNLNLGSLKKLYSYLGYFDVLYADRYIIEKEIIRYIRGFSKADRRLEYLSKITFLSFKINREIGSTATCSKIIKKSVYDKVGVYDFRFRRSEDTEWFSRCLDHGELVFGSFEQPLISQVYTNNSNKSNKKEWYYQVKLLAKNRGALKSRDIIFAYHWLCLKYLKSTYSLIFLSLCFFFRFYWKLLMMGLKPNNHINYNL